MRSARQSLIVVRYCRLRSGAQRKADVSHPVNLPRHATQCLLPRRITAATSNASETRETRRLREPRSLPLRDTVSKDPEARFSFRLDATLAFDNIGGRCRASEREKEREREIWEVGRERVVGRRVKDKIIAGITLNQPFSPIIGHPFPFTGK